MTTSPNLADFLNLDEFETAARTVLPVATYDYYAGGAWDEHTLASNRVAYQRIGLLPRALIDVSRRDLSTTVIGQPVSCPILIAPSAMHGLACPEGEIATARAAAAAQTIMGSSTLSNVSISDIAPASGGRAWFQLYVFRDRGLTRDLVARAEAAGAKGLLLTVDAPALGQRERDVRNRFTLPPGLRLANLSPAGIDTLPKEIADSGLSAFFAKQIDPALTWRDVEWLRSISSLPVIVKGIMHPADVQPAIDSGAAALVVSNHGGRQLDTAAATIEALPAIAAAANGAIEVLLDGGIRRGTDVFKALALGARAVLIARPVLWGLAVAGQAGVERVLTMLRDELDLTMALSGCTSLAEITPDLLLRR